MLGPTAHVDTFARDNLPPPDEWPDFRLDGFDYPEYVNAAVELTDRMVERGFGDRVALIGHGPRRTGPDRLPLSADLRQREYVQNGWNLTGDACSQDEDGYFQFIARNDDMIISAGYNTAGPEVEAALLAHEAVSECAVIGLPDEERGQIVAAFVVLEPNVVSDEATALRLQNHVKASIAPYKYPRAIRFLEALPKTQTGKIQRFQLKFLQ
jgi:acyl-CoA synthetase (AMP-forming)/AMP-acid ligase II